eukprot:11976998-Ditylum_brightwellii.AAC.1
MPSTDINNLECYVDADFAGAYSSANNEDLNRVWLRSGCVIMFASCSMTWFSQVQTEIALSTTETEYIALSAATKEIS